MSLDKYFSLEDGEAQVPTPLPSDVDDNWDPKQLAALLETDDDNARRVLFLMDSCESLEDYSRKVDDLYVDLGVESFAQAAGAVMDALIAWIKNLMQVSFNQLAMQELAARALEFKASNLKVTSRDRANMTGSGKFEITTRTQNLCVNYRPVKDITALMREIKTLRGIIKAYYDYVNHEAIQTVSGIVNMARTWSTPEQVASAMERHAPIKLNANAVFKTVGDTAGSSDTSHFLGCHRLVIEARSSVDMVSRVRGMAVRLKTSEPNPLPVPASITFTRFNLATSDACLDVIIDAANLLLTVNTSAIRQRRQAKLKEISSALEGLKRVMQQNADNSVRVSALRQTAGLLETLADWISTPYIGLYSLACRNLRAALNVCEQNAI